MSKLDRAREAYITLFEDDVRAWPEGYKRAVVADPRAFAVRLLEGLDIDDVHRLTRELRAELRLASRFR